ncbi:MAG: hypothetical protein ACU83N_06205 [Gammaproteobacteria bacterium]
MISFEIVVTLAATLTTLMLTILILGRNALRRKRLQDGFNALDQAKKLHYDKAHFEDLIKTRFKKLLHEKRPSYPFSFRFLVQSLFGIAVFIGFAGWAYYLLKQELITMAAISAVFSLLGMLIPFIVWRSFQQRDEAIGRLSRSVEHYEELLAQHNLERQRQKAAEIAASAAKAKMAKAAEAIPEDSVLRRHYLTQKQAEKEALTNPYPTDSVLRRHYDTMVRDLLNIERPSKVSEQPAVAMPAETETIPEDSVLRRHYLTQKQAEKEALTNPYPTDSVLRRHYDTMVRDLLNIERPSKVSEQPAVAMPAETETIPEDSVLRRHYLTQKQAEKEALTNPYPTDSVLRRHYDTMVRDLLNVERSDVSSPTGTASLKDAALKCHHTNKLLADIEAGLFPRPTDSVLRRHYDTLVETELEKEMEENAGAAEWMRTKKFEPVSKNLN